MNLTKYLANFWSSWFSQVNQPLQETYFIYYTWIKFQIQYVFHHKLGWLRVAARSYRLHEMPLLKSCEPILFKTTQCHTPYDISKMKKEEKEKKVGEGRIQTSDLLGARWRPLDHDVPPPSTHMFVCCKDTYFSRLKEVTFIFLVIKCLKDCTMFKIHLNVEAYNSDHFLHFANTIFICESGDI